MVDREPFKQNIDPLVQPCCHSIEKMAWHAQKFPLCKKRSFVTTAPDIASEMFFNMTNFLDLVCS